MADLELQNRNFENEFTAGFTTSQIVNADETIYNEDYIYDYVDGMLDGFDSEYKLELCERYDCSPRNLCDKLTEIYLSNPEEMRDLIDCSCYPNEISVNDVNYIFKSMSAGQHDTRDELLYAIDKELYDDIHILWDKYHLKQLDEKGLKLWESVIDRANKIDEDGEIEKFIKEYSDEIDENSY